ncbi:MAG TPA: PfkB family carbohydrate kinase [Streptosporangiaceae bacterium]|nr:PfkB family carbohydrate kinase [Streptosporangiaceae bacterium]
MGGAVADDLICVLGDANLDVVVCRSGPVAEETDTDVRTWVGAGGQAASVAAWILALGGQARLVAARGTDIAGGLVAAELARRGVEVLGPVVEGRTGVVVSLSDRGATRSMRTDRGVGPQLTAAALRERWLAGAARLHLPAYSLVSAPIRAAALAAADQVPNVSVDLSSTAGLREFGVKRFRDLLARLRPDIVFGNEAEADLVGDLPGADLVVKLGASGIRARGAVHQALPTRAVDATGAGDAFAAGYLLGGVSLGLQAAARAVARMGAMP